MEAGQSERKIYSVKAAEYQLLEEIGQGASAVVYRAMCLPFKEVVAIKALDLEKCNSSLVRVLILRLLALARSFSWLEFGV
jgi:serine/threonine protein kinase